MNNKRILVWIIISILGAAMFYLALSYSPNNGGDDQIVCTQEAKLCPDGSYVGRTGPNCEFTTCPNEVAQPIPTTGDVVLGVGQKGKVDDLNITVNSFVSDSRCPMDVQCIWEG